ARPPGSAGQATRGGPANGPLTFHSGHPVGADHTCHSYYVSVDFDVADYLAAFCDPLEITE
ncbi:hypothetical protein, partial [Methylobacterium isbiliense]|uniref:hypothetical protein n=1 Tax=Methylobacterium isbiliense TaxID=315478 RepID=UPI0025B28FF2